MKQENNITVQFSEKELRLVVAAILDDLLNN